MERITGYKTYHVEVHAVPNSGQLTPNGGVCIIVRDTETDVQLEMTEATARSFSRAIEEALAKKARR
jgi:hypothetical protein